MHQQVSKMREKQQTGKQQPPTASNWNNINAISTTTDDFWMFVVSQNQTQLNSILLLSNQPKQQC